MKCFMCLARGGVEGKGIRVLGLRFINPVGTGVLLDVCGLLWYGLCLLFHRLLVGNILLILHRG